jgi:uncharacterized protein YodC (DUF2158 family)
MSEPYVDSEGCYANYDEYFGLKIGDIVQLKSGGPEMTVAKISKLAESPDSEIEAECVWFSGDSNKGKFETHYEFFSPMALKKKINK